MPRVSTGNKASQANNGLWYLVVAYESKWDEEGTVART